MTPLNVPCPTKSILTRDLTSPNKASGELMLLVFSFLPDKDKIWRTIHKNVHNKNNESYISRATNWLYHTILERGSKLKESNT